VQGARFVLVDGRVAGTWTVVPDDAATTLRVTSLVGLDRPDTDAVVAEGHRLLALFTDDGARHRVEVSAA